MIPILVVLLGGTLSTVLGASTNYTLLTHLTKQTENLAHGLALAEKIGNIGSGRFGSRGKIVAFVARSTSDHTCTGSSDAKFPRVVTNIGNAYSASTGRFVTPIDGVYVFEWSINSYKSGHANVPGIYVNGSKKLSGYCKSASSTEYDTCSKVVPLELSAGDVVSIRSSSGTLYVDGEFSSFSGWLL